MPDGISIINDVLSPSFVYRSALDYAANLVTSKDQIYLAPANNFGYKKYEQELASEYLLKEYSGVNVVTVESSLLDQKYIDTRGNAIGLRLHLERVEKTETLPEIILVAAKFHARRARVAFEKEGFKISKLHKVDYSYPQKKEKIVPRLFYYNYPMVHQLYEWCATIREKYFY